MDIHILLSYFSSDRDFQRVDLSVCVCTPCAIDKCCTLFFHYFAIVCFIVPWCPSVHRAIHIIIYFRPDLSTCIVCRYHIVLLWSILIYIRTLQTYQLLCFNWNSNSTAFTIFLCSLFSPSYFCSSSSFIFSLSLIPFFSPLFLVFVLCTLVGFSFSQAIQYACLLSNKIFTTSHSLSLNSTQLSSHSSFLALLKRGLVTQVNYGFECVWCVCVCRPYFQSGRDPTNQAIDPPYSLKLSISPFSSFLIITAAFRTVSSRKCTSTTHVFPNSLPLLLMLYVYLYVSLSSCYFTSTTDTHPKCVMSRWSIYDHHGSRYFFLLKSEREGEWKCWKRDIPIIIKRTY